MRTIVRACIGIVAISFCSLFYLAVSSTHVSAQAEAKVAADNDSKSRPGATPAAQAIHQIRALT